MAKPGPKPKPTVIKQLFGNPGRRPLNDREPDPDKPARVPPAPPHLGDVGRKEWTRMGRELIKMGLLHNVGTAGLAGYCCAYELWVSAYQAVIEKGAVVKTAAGNIIQNPYLAVANRQQAEMRKWMTEFGITPSSMSRVTVSGGKKKVEDPAEKFFK